MYSCGKVLEKNWRLKRTPKTCFRKILIKQTIGQKYVQPSPPWCKETGKNIFGPGGGGPGSLPSLEGGGYKTSAHLIACPPRTSFKRGSGPWGPNQRRARGAEPGPHAGQCQSGTGRQKDKTRRKPKNPEKGGFVHLPTGETKKPPSNAPSWKQKKETKNG